MISLGRRMARAKPAHGANAGLSSGSGHSSVPASIANLCLGAQRKAPSAFLAIALLWAAPTFAADNFAINNATGTFTVIRCTESAGVCTLNTTISGAISVESRGYTSPATITRPANTTAYTANDVLGGVITFATAGPVAGGDLTVTSVELEADITAIPAGMTSFSLYLYSVTPPSALADNAAFDLPAGDRASFIGKIAMGTPVDEGSTLYIRADNVNAHIKTASGTVFGYLVTAGGFTPAANSEVYKVTLHGVAP